MAPRRGTANSSSSVLHDDSSTDYKRFEEILNDKFEILNQELTNMKQLLNSEKEERLILQNKVSTLESKNIALEQKVARLQSGLDDKDAYTRRETLILNGTDIPVPTPGENCSNIVRDVVKNKLKIILQPSDISVAHRSGKKPTNQTVDRRGIHVKFCRRDTKRDIMMAKRDNSDPQHTLFINECLTPMRRSILFALRQMKKKFPSVVKGCTTQEGRVYAFTPSTSTSGSRDRKHLVNSHDALVQFCRDYIQEPLDNFLNSWNY